MATTRLIPMHCIKGQSIAQTVNERLNYAMNPDKTQEQTLVTAYGCDAKTAAAEMLLCKASHDRFTGQPEEKASDIILYQIRQSFKPGEITPELAQEIGIKLAQSFTKGKHQYVVSTHTDKAHIHNHIIFNATTLDARRKFRNFLGSSKAIRTISDQLCLEYGLSIVVNPSQKHQHYAQWLGSALKYSYKTRLKLVVNARLT